MRKQLTLLAVCLMAALAWAQSPVLKVEGGMIQGVPSSASGVTVFRGIPYAAPPVGDLRYLTADFPELLEFPFLWQQIEYVLGGGSSHYMFLILAANH